MLGVTAFVEDLDRDLCPDSDDFLGPDVGSQVRFHRGAPTWGPTRGPDVGPDARFHRVCSLKKFLVPAAAVSARENFRSLMGRRLRLLGLSDSQTRAISSRGADFRVGEDRIRSSDPKLGSGEVRRRSDPQSAIQERNRGAAVEASVEKRPRFA